MQECFDGGFTTIYVADFRYLVEFGSKAETAVQIFYSHDHKFKHKLPVTVALRKKSSRKTRVRQESKGGIEHNKGTKAQ